LGRERTGIDSRRKILIESQIESLNFIGGEWVPADSGETSEIVNPSNPSEPRQMRYPIGKARFPQPAAPS
jgi:hypothetical protein